MEFNTRDTEMKHKTMRGLPYRSTNLSVRVKSTGIEKKTILKLVILHGHHYQSLGSDELVKKQCCDNWVFIF